MCEFAKEKEIEMERGPKPKTTQPIFSPRPISFPAAHPNSAQPPASASAARSARPARVHASSSAASAHRAPHCQLGPARQRLLPPLATARRDPRRDSRRPSPGRAPQDPRRLLKRPSPHPRNPISTSAATPKPSCRRTAPLHRAAALRRRGYAAPPHRSPGRGAHRLRLDLWSFPGPAALHSNLCSDLLRERRPRPPPGLRRRPPCAAAPSTTTPR